MSRVADRFGAAAATYDDATPIQRQAAEALAARVAEAEVAPGARVAEFGCGSGHLGRALTPLIAPDLWIATDLAPPMAALAARTLPQGALVAVMDAARPALAPGFDLVCSSLTLQWLGDPAAVLARWRGLVRPGGLLAVATLAEGSFGEWRAALAEAGVREPKPVFPKVETIRGWFGAKADLRPLPLIDRHLDGLAFARSARAAGIDAGFGRALDAGTMRRALKAYEAKGSTTRYEVVLAVERVG